MMWAVQYNMLMGLISMSTARALAGSSRMPPAVPGDQLFAVCNGSSSTAKLQLETPCETLANYS